MRSFEAILAHYKPLVEQGERLRYAEREELHEALGRARYASHYVYLGNFPDAVLVQLLENHIVSKVTKALLK